MQSLVFFTGFLPSHERERDKKVEDFYVKHEPR